MEETALDLSRTYVRVLGLRRDRFVEFEFSVGDRDLTVELVLPIEEFRDFCRRERSILLPPDPAARSIFERLCGDGRTTGPDEPGPAENDNHQTGRTA